MSRLWGQAVYLHIVIVAILSVEVGIARELSTDSPQDIVNCDDQSEASRRAFLAQDWSQISKFATNLIRYCSERLDQHTVATVYSELAMANFERGLIKEALFTAQSGIMAEELVIQNHIEKFRALLSLGHLKDARNTSMRTVRAIQEAVKRNQSDLSNTIDKDELSLYQSRKELLKVQLGFIEVLNKKLKFLEGVR